MTAPPVLSALAKRHKSEYDLNNIPEKEQEDIPDDRLQGAHE
jgi:hypothetical protein